MSPTAHKFHTMDISDKDQAPLLKNGDSVSSFLGRTQTTEVWCLPATYPRKSLLGRKRIPSIKLIVVIATGISMTWFAISFLLSNDISGMPRTTNLSRTSIAGLHQSHIIPPSQTLYQSRKSTTTRKFIPHFQPEPLFEKMLGNMSTAESGLWQQIKLLYGLYSRGQAVGARHPQAKFNLWSRAAPLASQIQGQLKDCGDPIFSYNGGDKEKHYALLGLLQSVRDGQYTHGGLCPSRLDWMKKHATIQREMLSAKRSLKITQFICAQNCGGLADRTLGMVTSLAFSLANDRAWVADWQDHQLVEDFYDSAGWIDWSFPSTQEEVNSNPVFSNMTHRTQTVVDNLLLNAADLDRVWEEYDWQTSLNTKNQSIHPLTLASKSDWLKFYADRGTAYRFFKYSTARTKFNSMGIYQDSIYNCLMDYLFRPRVEILDFTAPISAYLSLPTVFSVGIQIRTGDAEMIGIVNQDTVRNSVKHRSHFFECAEQVAKRFAQSDQKIVYYLMTDSQMLKEDAQKSYPDRLLTNNQRPKHMAAAGDLQGSASAVADLEIMRKTDIKIVTFCSGLGTLAALRTPNQNRRIIAFPRTLDQPEDPFCVIKPERRQQRSCMLDEVFVSIDELTSTWSLA